MGRIRKAVELNANLLDDDFYMSGEGLEDAETAFHRMEGATVSMRTDISISSVLSVVNRNKNVYGCLLMDGAGELEVLEDGCVGLKDALFVNVMDKVGAAPGKVENGMFLFAGGCYKTPVMLDDPDLIVMGKSAMKPLAHLLRIEHIQKGYFRDAAIAGKLESLDEKEISFLCREENGVRKAVCCFSRSDGMGFLRFDELMEMMPPGTEVAGWSISQEIRSVTFVPEGKEIKVTWSDTCSVPITLEHDGKTKKVKRDDLEGYIRELCQFIPEKTVCIPFPEAETVRTGIFYLCREKIEPERTFHSGANARNILSFVPGIPKGNIFGDYREAAI